MRNHPSYPPLQPEAEQSLAILGNSWRSFTATCRVLGLVAGLVACATPPAPTPAPAPMPVSYAVLLENADGTVGNILLQQEKGEVVLNQPRQGANIDGLATAPYQVDEERIKRDFGSAMGLRPPLPVNFLLYFESGGTRLTAASQELIPKIVEASSNRPVPDITVIGHTDTAGTAAANEKLALDRARFVAGLLSTAGMVAHELTVASHGESNLLVKTPDDTAEPRNRRVEISVR
ncbi:MAG: OmpA family protein [Rhodoferax sp.]|nr:OmpA family protein [Rhodoferax sp.]